MLSPAAKERIAALLGPRGYLDRPEDLALYEYDGGVDEASPRPGGFPAHARQVAEIVRIAREFDVPFVGRGAGTGLSGGAIPREGGVMMAFARMNQILETDLDNERAVVEPGVVNFDITQAVEGQGYFYAPDPSSQKACTIGGNVAENAGGPHTLAYGVTTNHVLGLELVLPDGSVVETGGKEPDLPGLRPHRPADRLGRHHGPGHQHHRSAHAQGRVVKTSWPFTNRTRTPAAPSPKSPPAPSRRSPSRCSMASCCAWWRKPPMRAIPWMPARCC